MVDKKASLTDLDFDKIVSSNDKNVKIVPKKRFSNAIKTFLSLLIGLGAAAGVFYLIYFFAR